MFPNISKKIQALSILVGNTPLLDIEYKYKGENRRIYAKAEHMNISGSIKDRMALYILKSAYEKGKLNPDATEIGVVGKNIDFYIIDEKKAKEYVKKAIGGN